MPCDSLSGGVGKQHCNLTALASKCDVHAMPASLQVDSTALLCT